MFQKIGIKKYINLYSSFLMTTHAAYYGIPPTPSFVPGESLDSNLTPTISEFFTSSPPPFSFVERFKNQIGYFISGLIMNKLVDRTAEAFPPNNVTGNIWASCLLEGVQVVLF